MFLGCTPHNSASLAPRQAPPCSSGREQWLPLLTRTARTAQQSLLKYIQLFASGCKRWYPFFNTFTHSFSKYVLSAYTCQALSEVLGIQQRTRQAEVCALLCRAYRYYV